MKNPHAHHGKVIFYIYVTLEHKTNHKGQFLEIDDNIWLRYNYLKIWNLKNII